jgi:hypothetical protein
MGLACTWHRKSHALHHSLPPVQTSSAFTTVTARCRTPSPVGASHPNLCAECGVVGTACAHVYSLTGPAHMMGLFRAHVSLVWDALPSGECSFKLATSARTRRRRRPCGGRAFVGTVHAHVNTAHSSLTGHAHRWACSEPIPHLYMTRYLASSAAPS